MDLYALPVWIYLAVLTVFVGGAMKKILASHLGASPPLVAWLGAAVLAERLFALCPPALMLLLPVLLGLCIFARSAAPSAALPAAGKAVLVTGKTRPEAPRTSRNKPPILKELFPFC